MNFRIALFILLLPSTVTAQTPARAAVIAAASDIIQKAHYCTFITIDEAGHPQARIVDPIAPDGNFTIWFATNPRTRKVDQVRRNPKVTLSCFDAATSSYVTVLGRGDLVTEVVEKRGHWKPDWAAIYPGGANSDAFMLIRITPARLEIVSESRAIIGDAKTWLPLAIEFPANRQPSVRESDAEMIEAAKAAIVRKLDPSLPEEPLIDWLDDVVGSRTPRKWEVNDCGEHSGSPQPGRDSPICAEVEVTMPDGRQLRIAVGVGTQQRGLTATTPGIYYAVVSQPDGSTKSIGTLSDLPGAIRDRDTGIDVAARSFITAFNNLDMPAFLDRFAEDATIVHPPAAPPRTFPTRLQGKQEIQRTFQVVFDLIRSSSGRAAAPYQDLQPRDLLVQQYDRFAVLTFHLGAERRIGRRTLVLRRIGSDWKIVHLHASTFELPQ